MDYALPTQELSVDVDLFQIKQVNLFLPFLPMMRVFKVHLAH